MGNYIQRAEIDLQNYSVTEILKEEGGLEISRLQNLSEPREILLTKEITDVVSQMPESYQLEVLRRIEQQPLWWTLLKFDEFARASQTVNLMITNISQINLEAEIMSLRSTGMSPSITNSWYILTNLLLAVIDMENKLEFNEHISMKNIYLNTDKSLTMLNPYFRDSHLKKALQDIIKPISLSTSWKPEYSSNYFARLDDLSKNPEMRAIHFVHQNYVADMLKSVALAMLGLLSLRSDSEFVLNPEKKKIKTELNMNLINQLFKQLDDAGFDGDLLDVLEYIINYEPRSAIEFCIKLQERQYSKMITSFKESTFVCSDPEAARRLLPYLRGQNPYDPNVAFQVSTSSQNTGFLGQGQRPAQPTVPAPPLLGPSWGNPPILPQVKPSRVAQETAVLDTATAYNNRVSTNANENEPKTLQPADKLNVLKGWMEGSESTKAKEPVATEIRKLRDFSAGPDGRPNLNGVELKDRPAKNIEFLKDYMTMNSKVPSKIVFDATKGFSNAKTATDTLPPQPPAPKAPIDKLEFNSAPLIKPHICRCHVQQSHTCRCRQIGNAGTQCATNHMNYPLYSPYSHLYYMGKPVLSHTSHILHDYPQSST